MAARRDDVWITSAGERLAGWLYRPDGPAPHACVVMAHGFSATRRDALPAYAEHFAAAGFAVLLFDYRFFGESTGEPRQLIDVAAQQADWRAAIAWARAVDDLDADRIALWGSSFSGGHVVTVAAGDPRLAAVVAQVPFADGVATLRFLHSGHTAGLVRAALADELGARLGRPPRYVPAVADPGGFAPMNAPEAKPGFASIVGPDSLWRNEFAARLLLRLPLFRPIRLAGRVTAPTLVVIAENDATVPPDAARALAAKLPHGESVSYPLGHFEIYTGAPFARAVADQTAFLERHLATRTGAAR